MPGSVTTPATIIFAATCTGLATTVGALPVIALRPVGRRTYDTVLGFGAGLMIWAATIGLLGHALSARQGKASLWPLVVGFFLGVGVMFLMERLMPHLHAKGHHEHLHDHHGDHPAVVDGQRPHEHVHEVDDTRDASASRKGLLIAGAMTLHRIPEGFAIGAGFMLGHSRLGLFLTLALALQNICEGVVLSVPLMRGGLSRAGTVATVTATGLATPLAAVVGVLFAEGLGDTLPAGLALAAGALLYLVVSEILPESHSHGNEKAASLALAAGFGVGLGLHVLLDH